MLEFIDAVGSGQVPDRELLEWIADRFQEALDTDRTAGEIKKALRLTTRRGRKDSMASQLYQIKNAKAIIVKMEQGMSRGEAITRVAEELQAESAEPVDEDIERTLYRHLRTHEKAARAFLGIERRMEAGKHAQAVQLHDGTILCEQCAQEIPLSQIEVFLTDEKPCHNCG